MQNANQIKPGRAFAAAKRFGKAGPLVVLGVAALFCLIAVAKSSAAKDGQLSQVDGEPSSSSREAVQDFWTIYHGNNYAAIPKVQKELQSAIQSDPNNPTLYALLGATYFWHVGEYTRDPKPDPSVLAQEMPTAQALFQKAVDLDYYSPHAIGYLYDDHLPGYLGITTVHTGQEHSDPTLIAKGDQLLDFAVYQFPEFNNFNRWAAHNGAARDSDTYKQSLDSLWLAIDACIGTSIDRSNPDMKPYLQLVTSVGRKKACWWQGDIAPYAFEGLILNLGNGLVKAGQVDAAKVMYANARYADNYTTWPYRNVLESLAAADLNARAAMYAPGANPQDAPPLSVPNRSCVYCHATVPEPAAQQ